MSFIIWTTIYIIRKLNYYLKINWHSNYSTINWNTISENWILSQNWTGGSLLSTQFTRVFKQSTPNSFQALFWSNSRLQVRGLRRGLPWLCVKVAGYVTSKTLSGNVKTSLIFYFATPIGPVPAVTFFYAYFSDFNTPTTRIHCQYFAWR